MLKKIFTHSLIYGLAPQIGVIAGFIALPIITKDLTAIDFGIWGIFAAYSGALGGLYELGLSVQFSNSFFKMRSQYKWMWRQLYGFLLLIRIPVTLLVFFLLYILKPSGVVSSEWILLICLGIVPGLIFGPINTIGVLYYQLNLKPMPIALRSAFFGFLTVLLQVYTISYLKLGFLGWAWSGAIVSSFISLSYFYPIVIRHRLSPIFNFKLNTIKSSLKLSLPTVPHGYANYLLNSSDRIVMDRLAVGITQIGEYSIASRFSGYFNGLNLATTKAIGPMMTAMLREKNFDSVRTLTFVIVICLLSFTSIFSIWSKEIFDILIKNDVLKRTYPLAIVLIMMTNYRSFYLAAVQQLSYNEKTNILWKVSFIAGLSNIALNILLIPYFGIKAAVFSTYICTLFLGFGWYLIPNMNKEIIGEYYPYRWLLVIILSTALNLYLVDTMCIYKVFISIIWLAISLYFLLLNRNRINAY